MFEVRSSVGLWSSSKDFQFLFGLSCKMGFGESPSQKSLFRPGTYTTTPGSAFICAICVQHFLVVTLGFSSELDHHANDRLRAG